MTDVRAVEGASAPPVRVPPGRRETVSRILTGLLRLIGGIIALVFLAWLILFITKGRFLKPYFERYVSRQTERQVKVAGDFQLFLNPIDIKFLAERMTISNPAWAGTKNLFDAAKIDTNIATIPLIFGKRRVNWLEMADGDVNLEWDAAGKRNTWTFGAAKGEPLELPTILRASVAGSDVHYRAPQLDFTADVSIDTIKARDTRFADDVRFSGGGSLRDRRFTLSGNLMSPNETVAGGRNKLALHAESLGNVLDVSGTLAGATQFDGAALKMSVRGPNLADLFDFIGVATPDTRRYRINSNLTKAGATWRFTALRGTFGDSDIGGWMTVSMPKTRIKIDADVRSRVLDIVDAGPFVGYDPRRLDAMGGKGAIKTEGGVPRVLPDAQLRIEALKRFDADVKYRIARVRAESFPISNIAMTVNLDRSLLRLDPLTFDVAGGHLASNISIDARRRPVFTRYDIRLSPTPMGRLLARFGAEQSGATGMIRARVQMTGEGDSVRKSLATADGRIAFIMPAGTFWTRNVQLAELDIGTFAQKMFEKKLKEPIQINCGLIAFTVRNGIAAADPILIDTRKNVIAGRGAFSFRNESLDLAMEADSKTFSAFSGQSPIGVGGYFAAPKVDPISGELLTRAGLGLGLAALVSPVALVVAFVDPGNAESTSCGPVLSGARAAAQREKDGGPVKGLSEKGGKKPGEKKKRKKFLGIF